MRNAEILQQNNARLNENNIDLTSILDTINNLPDVIEIKLQEKSAIPTTEEQEVIADEGYTGLSKVTVAGEENLIPDNIKQGVSIFGVEGNAKTSNLKITDASNLFRNGARLDNKEEFFKLFENITTMESMFEATINLVEVDLSNLDTSNVTKMGAVFQNCMNLQRVNLSNLDISNVTSMSSMFYNCYELIELNLEGIDTSKVEFFGTFLYNCYKLTSLIMLDCSSATNVNNILKYCGGLINFGGLIKLGKAYTKKYNGDSSYKLDLSSCSKLTHESLMNVINNLYDLNLTYDVANGGTLYTQQLVLGSTNMAKLTPEEIAIATNKGWSVS